jgi:hypothetical protein
MNACPATMTLMLRSCLSPRIGRSHAFNLPWSHSIPFRDLDSFFDVWLWTPSKPRCAGLRGDEVGES